MVSISLLLIAVIFVTVSAAPSQLSLTATDSVTGTILWFGGQSSLGEAVTVRSG